MGFDRLSFRTFSTVQRVFICFLYRFNLSEDGQIPRKIITIDSDDEEEQAAKASTLSEHEMQFFTTLKVKPKELSESQDEQFDLLAGVKIPASERRRSHISSSFDRIRANQSSSAAARIRLIDFYRMRKHKIKTRSGRFRYGIRKVVINSSADRNGRVEELNKENLKSGDIIQVSQRSLRRGDRRTNFRVLHLTGQKSIAATSKEGSATNGSAEGAVRRSSPRNFRASNGMYRVVENSIDKSQSTKIVMKIAKPTNSSKDVKVNGTSEHSLLSDGYSPARDIPAIEDHMTEKCNQIRISCKKLPKNPLTWTKNHVAEFVQAADLNKYARIFLEEVSILLSVMNY